MSLMKDIFGLSKDEVWKEFADEIGGEYIDQGFWKGKKLVVKIQDWTMVMDTFSRSSGKHSTTYTRIRAPFKTIDELTFKITKSGFFSDLGKALGMQDIETGDTIFDQKFIIKGNHEMKIRELFSSEKIRQITSKLDQVSLEIKEGKGLFSSNLVEGAYELYFEQVGKIKDLESLRDIFTIFILVLERLVSIGSAVEIDISDDIIK